MALTTITALGSGRYAVNTAGVRHTVDVRAWRYNGDCTCPTFTGCCLYLLTNQRDSRRQRCDHTLAVREWIMEHEWPSLTEAANKIIEMPGTGTRSHVADLADR